MFALLSLLGPFLVLSPLIALALVGLRNGDLAGDPSVSARVEPMPGGAWVELRVENTGPDIALVGARIGRLPRLAGQAPRRGAGRSRSVRLADQIIGTVGPEDAESLWLFAEGSVRRRQIVATVGLPGRLRVHRIALQTLAAEDDRLSGSARSRANRRRAARAGSTAPGS